MRTLFLFTVLTLTSCSDGSREVRVVVPRVATPEEILEEQRMAQKEMEMAADQAKEIRDRLDRAEQKLK